MKINSSFRDPSGFVFKLGDTIYRQINNCYRKNYDHLIQSGLYEKLLNEHLLVPHEEIEKDSLPFRDSFQNCYKIIKPDCIPFISYPYEWCFSQLKSAALTTLKVQKLAIRHGMTLKDANAYNIQFKEGSPVLIDSLSFEIDEDKGPWIAYRQFCQHFFSPLSLMHFADIRLNQFARIYMDGVPLQLASRLLPFRTYLYFSQLMHIHLHAKYQSRYSGKQVSREITKKKKVNPFGFIDNLEAAIKKLCFVFEGTEWRDYYENTNYSEDTFAKKKQIVSDFLGKIQPKDVWDLGANTGIFSRIASEKGIPTISFDVDPECVEINYREVVARKEKNILPLLMDLTNPSPSIGWKNHERLSLMERGPVDAVLALALVHHLAIANNVPFEEMVHFFADICRFLIIEFIPKKDSQVRRLLAFREDIFQDYSQSNFEQLFGKKFNILQTIPMQNPDRVLYLMEKMRS